MGIGESKRLQSLFFVRIEPAWAGYLMQPNLQHKGPPKSAPNWSKKWAKLGPNKGQNRPKLKTHSNWAPKLGTTGPRPGPYWAPADPSGGPAGRPNMGPRCQPSSQKERLSERYFSPSKPRISHASWRYFGPYKIGKQSQLVGGFLV